MIHNRILVKENLGKKGVILDSECKVCSFEIESVNHVLLDCQVAKRFWDKVRNWWDIPNSNMDSIENVKGEFVSHGNNKTEKQVVKVVCFAVLTVIWRCRNELIFQDKRRSGEEMFFQVQKEAFHWIVSRAVKVNIDRVNWHDNPRLAVKDL